MSEQTDASLVGAALAGEAEAFCALVRRYQDHVYGVALGILADFHLALDAAQEAFLCAYCDLPRLKDPVRFGGWLCGIARNTAFEVRRDRQRQEALLGKAAERGECPDLAPSSEQLAGENEQRTLVQRALVGVNEKDREALMLYYADGLSYAEICGFLGVSQGTLKGRLQRGRTALRKELTMVEQACKDNAPDEAFTRSLERAIRVFGAKGPATHHLPSAWHQSLRKETGRILEDGEEGYRVDLALSHSGSARQRYFAATRLGLRGDDRSLGELARMLEDRSPRVRRQALRWFAGRIHPDPAATGPFITGRPAVRTVGGLDHLLDRAVDANFNVRLAAVVAIGAYRDAGDPRVVQGLQKALDDPKHKVRHAAARILAVPCPGCGRTW
ncbi:MAG TPA: sigma-70 family RNA polymerase sigma factor [Phycisphaerae bacterium]|nr:sigma-70 family RNA polymerase sigma factor [Phycisphaerae bacterium]